MSDYLFFKTDREREQFLNLDPRLRGLALAVAAWQYGKWGIGVTITCIARTASENEAVGGVSRSAHVLEAGQIWHRAFDMRNNDLTLDQRRERHDYIMTNWNWRVMPPMIHTVDHNNGKGGDHTHVNLNLAYKL